MILYFSATGNSKYVAKRIGKTIGDEIGNLFDKIKNNDFSQIHSERPWVIVVPTYAWRIPHIVEDCLTKTQLTGNGDIYFVMTCGGSIGNAGKYLKKFCTEKKMNYRGCMGITMPENYIALFSTPTEEQALQIIDKAESVIDRTAQYIKNNDNFPQSEIFFGDKINSGIVNDLFYPMFVHAKKFYSTEACISCGKCVKVCPLNNVRLKNGKPVWGKDCTHCMACINKCPAEAIEYGKHSKGLHRYVFPKNKAKK